MQIFGCSSYHYIVYHTTSIIAKLQLQSEHKVQKHQTKDDKNCMQAEKRDYMNYKLIYVSQTMQKNVLSFELEILNYTIKNFSR